MSDLGPAVLLALTGRLEIKDVERVQARLMGVFDSPPGAGIAIIDVSGLDAIDTAGAQLLLAAKRDALCTGLTLQYRGASKDLHRVLELLGLREAVLGRVLA